MSVFDWLTTRLPKPQRGPRGLAWVGVVAAGFDGIVSNAKLAAKLDLPAHTLDEALPYVGADRVITRAPGESLDAYRERLAGAWESWGWVGTRYGIARAVGLLGVGTPQVATVRDFTPLGWPLATRWAFARLLWVGRASWGTARWGTFKWGAARDEALDALTDAEARAMLRPVLRQWLGARDRVLDVTISRGGNLWGRIRWGGSFAWGTPGPSRRIGPARWGAARWGDFTWGAFL